MSRRSSARRSPAPPPDRPLRARTRKRGRYAKSRETRERILAAALEVAGRVGFHRTSVAAIAEGAQVAVGNVHYHFGSRDELLHELMKWVADELLAEVRRALAASGDAFAMEEASLRAYLGFVRRRPAYVRLVEEVRLHHPDLYRSTMSLWLDLIRDALAQAMGRGEIRAMDEAEVHALAYFVLGTRYFVDQMMNEGQGEEYPGDDAVVAAYLNLIRSGLEKRVESRQGSGAGEETA